MESVNAWSHFTANAKWFRWVVLSEPLATRSKQVDDINLQFWKLLGCSWYIPPTYTPGVGVSNIWSSDWNPVFCQAVKKNGKLWVVLPSYIGIIIRNHKDLKKSISISITGMLAHLVLLEHCLIKNQVSLRPALSTGGGHGTATRQAKKTKGASKSQAWKRWKIHQATNGH